MTEVKGHYSFFWKSENHFYNQMASEPYLSRKVPEAREQSRISYMRPSMCESSGAWKTREKWRAVSLGVWPMGLGGMMGTGKR